MLGLHVSAAEAAALCAHDTGCTASLAVEKADSANTLKQSIQPTEVLLTAKNYSLLPTPGRHMY
jgi:hypothetical protein